MQWRSKILLILCIIFLSCFGVLAHEVVTENEDWFDTRIFVFLQDYSSTRHIEFFKVISFFGSIGFIVSSFSFITLWLVFAKKKRDALAVGLTGIVTGLLIEGLKFLFHRLRPDKPHLEPLHNFSFPSGHAFSAFIFYSLLSLIIYKSRWSKSWKIVCIGMLYTFIFAIGGSRIILRYHYASDVLAGFLLGAACLFGYLTYTGFSDKAAFLSGEAKVIRMKRKKL